MFSLNQDTPAGHYSYFVAHNVNSAGQSTASVTVTEIRKTTHWAPFVTFELGIAGERSNRARLEISFKDQASATLFVQGHGSQNVSAEIPGQFAVGQPTELKLKWQGGSFVEVNVNGSESHRLSIPFVPNELRIVSGSASVDINNVTLQ